MTACESENHLYIHTAQVLTQILSILTNGSHHDTIEDTCVHYYLSLLLSSVSASDFFLKLGWENSQLKKDIYNASKPNFLVYNLTGSIKCFVVIAEFKSTEQNSYVESDMVKLTKQMKIALSELIINGVRKPKVCGIHCKGENVNTYVTDLSSPKLQKMINTSKVKLFKNLDRTSILPDAISHMLCLKEVASENRHKDGVYCAP
ncbi:uncharacterized protein B0P05DRAFT_529336 [Gilbertella persicaria]|uniref:uncharacterized protein n=1 Tax=Gilbertella persicaria TaxID=101096 RepID=UPI00222036B3|nr:uncharacterized protein B0P05DRAFT_529336 [Gilbertella persicaria]KAI8090102.1 hypothetical protein B0P05DRAFT_529336 [Gilbertella persicaria]